MIALARKNKSRNEARSQKSVKSSNDAHIRKTLGEEQITEGASTFVADPKNLEGMDVLGGRIQRPNRNRPINDAEYESSELCADPEFMDSFRKGAKELDEGKGIEWKTVKKNLGL